MATYLQKFLHKFHHLEIQLEEITSATDNFNVENCIGVGGYGKVYKGEVSHYRGRSMVAIKRLNSSGGQGTPEFLKEITTLSRYSHENLISLVGFCYQGEEMILVYEHASRGSLDRYLKSPHLKWSQRIKICLDAAKGLGYLHDPGETHQRLIHCDVKSGNILLDDQWNAKVADLGLSIMGSANEQQSVIVTLAAGTLGYIDPEYMITHTLTKESDVYSLGVVLFEVLCGTVCYTCSDGRTQKTLVPTWTESYEQKKLNDIIFESSTVEPLDQSTLEIFSDIAYRCLNESREDRPMMSEVITELKAALESEQFIERMQLFDYKEMIKRAEPPLDYSSPYELWKFLRKGVLLNEGKTWFSLNKKGDHCEMISFAKCLDSCPSEPESAYDSRFAAGPCRLHPGEKYKLHVKTKFLSPGITYTMVLMLRKTELQHLQWVSIEYKLEGETETSNSYIAYESDGGYWWQCELYQFTSEQSDHEFLFEFETAHCIEVESIDFRPVQEVEHTADKKQSVSEPDANWEEKLPPDYEDMLKGSTISWTTKKEAYSILRKGFLMSYNDREGWISLDNDGNICILRGDIFERDNLGSIIQSESRFGEVFVCTSRIPDISIPVYNSDYDSDDYDINEELVVPHVVYLVYKLPKDFEMKHRVLKVNVENSHWYVYLSSPETPVIRPKAHQNTHNPTNRLPKIKGLPRQRDDGWMEVKIWELQSEKPHYVNLEFPEAVTGLIIQGIELRLTPRNLPGSITQHYYS